LLDILRRDLLQRTVSPAIIRAAYRQPVAVLRFLKTIGGDWLVILQDRRHGNRRLGGLLLLRGHRSRKHKECDGYSNDGHETSPYTVAALYERRQSTLHCRRSQTDATDQCCRLASSHDAIRIGWKSCKELQPEDLECRQLAERFRTR